MTTHVMVDIETIDTRPEAAVLSVGAVVFSFDKGPQTFPYYSSMEINSQLIKGRRVNHDTLKFWAHQEDDARHAAFNGGAETAVVLGSLAGTIRSGLTGPDATIWAYPAAFDLAILTGLFADYNLVLPWHYRQQRCARTLHHLAGNPDPGEVNMAFVRDKYPRHHPIYDCALHIAQARASRIALQQGALFLS